MILTDSTLPVLQDPSVAGAPLEQRMAFLRSKNLTPEEIDAALARAGQAGAAGVPQASSVAYRQPVPQYNAGYPGYWQQSPPELPRRDWRDWFIAATVMGGVGYALYWTARRYVVPIIAPPTPPQLEQDKAEVDASFDKAFALLEQLATDTQELKRSEADRKERLDAALNEVENVISRMKQANEDRDLEAKRVAREIGEIRDQIPRAIEKEKEATDNRLKELNNEMKSLKTLVANRMSAGQAPQRTTPSFSTNQSTHQHIPAIPGSVNGMSSESSAPAAAPVADESASSRPAPTSANSGSGTPYSRLLNGKAAIPSWQLAAKKRSEEAQSEGSSASQQNLGESGTVSDAIQGEA